MATGICYTQSGNVKRYEASCLRAHWTSKISYEDIEESLIPYIPTPSYTPPKGYILSDKGIYTYTYNCAYLFYPKPYNIIYGDKVRTIENEESMFIISKDFEVAW